LSGKSEIIAGERSLRWDFWFKIKFPFSKTQIHIPRFSFSQSTTLIRQFRNQDISVVNGKQFEEGQNERQLL
tara:strand:- start:109 stop:324 length:216 start_codon:yes stop_codon:yes gene_type:complete